MFTKKINLLIILALSLSVAFYFREGIFAKSMEIAYYSPCENPKPYKIGSIDEKFGIDREELIADLEKSTQIWEDVAGKNLFTYDDNAKLTVNLQYDSRQELNTKIDELDNNLKQKRGELDPKLEEFKRRSTAFSSRISEFNKKVDYWNSQNGAPQEEYEKLIKEQESLRDESEALSALSKELGQTTNLYNEEVSRLNQTINIYDETLQGKPEEGLYEKDGQTEKITIYLHTSKQEFIHTLAHEFGHSLGISHISNPNAIMYSKANDAITVTRDDLIQLEEVCKERFVAEVVLDHYERVFEAILLKALHSF